MAQKRPVYVVQIPTGVMIPTEDRKELEEAIILVGVRQTRFAAEKLASGQEGAEVVKKFLTDD